MNRGYHFAWDDENIVELVCRGAVAAGVVSDRYDKALADERKSRVVVFDRTIEVPRHLGLVSPSLSRSVTDRVRELLDQPQYDEDGRGILEGLSDTTRFDELPRESTKDLQKLAHIMNLVPRG